ncbi:magnesium transporter CorA family protein [Xylocopilactobacillus apicola]|uniref:Magnesium transporter n=1 Tax=Xylocopilactobacillus apicola TaxID=2932184 RepID=A0AAU9DEE2_9LACO|nr:magnesium transporter CorA family protein [Xylocopilactobacillus apicola]BDR59237.1 magnesium transporter [Xylocopilactobacillus apicola]
MIKTENSYSNFEWIQIINPSDEEIGQVRADYNLSWEMIQYATDNFESPRYDHYEDTDLVIVNGIAEKVKKGVKIQPIAFFIQNSTRLITFTNYATSQMLSDIIQKMPEGYKESIPPEKMQPFDLVLNAFYNLTAQYLDALSEVERKRNLLQSELYHKRNSEYLSELLNVKVELIYYLSALEKNRATLQQFRKEYQQKIDTPEIKYLRDIEIEMKQALDMANISTKIMNLLSDAYENIVNNKTNRSMSILTVASIVLAIPAIIVGFFGMNVTLPGEEEASAWLLITIGTILLMFWVYIILKKRGFFN